MNKKILGLALATLLSVSVSLLAISKTGKNSSEAILAPEVEALAYGEGSPFGTQWQTMGYCPGQSITYKCSYNWTSEFCRRCYCWD